MLAFPLMGWNHMSSSYGFMAMQTENETCMALTNMWSLATRPIVIASRITLALSKSKTAVSIETDHPSLSDSASRWTASRNRLAPESSWDMVLCVAQPSRNVSRSKETWNHDLTLNFHQFILLYPMVHIFCAAFRSQWLHWSRIRGAYRPYRPNHKGKLYLNLSSHCPIYNDTTGLLEDGDCFCDSDLCNSANHELLSTALALISSMIIGIVINQ